MFTRTRLKGPETTPPDRRGSLPDKELLTPAEVAAFFGVNVRTVRAWVEEGKLPAIRTPGGQIRIPAAAIRGW